MLADDAVKAEVATKVDAMERKFAPPLEGSRPLKGRFAKLDLSKVADDSVRAPEAAPKEEKASTEKPELLKPPSEDPKNQPPLVQPPPITPEVRIEGLPPPASEKQTLLALPPQEERTPDNLLASQERTFQRENTTEVEARERAPSATTSEREVQKFQKEERASPAELKSTTPVKETPVIETTAQEAQFIKQFSPVSEIRGLESQRRESAGVEALQKEQVPSPLQRDEQTRHPEASIRAESRLSERQHPPAAELRHTPEEIAVRVRESVTLESVRRELVREEAPLRVVIRSGAPERITALETNRASNVQNIARAMRDNPGARRAPQSLVRQPQRVRGSDIRLSRAPVRNTSGGAASKGNTSGVATSKSLKAIPRRVPRAGAHGQVLPSQARALPERTSQRARNPLREAARMQLQAVPNVRSRELAGDSQRIALTRVVTRSAVPRADVAAVRRERSTELKNVRPTGSAPLGTRRGEPLETRRPPPRAVKAEVVPTEGTLKQGRVSHPERASHRHKDQSRSLEKPPRAERKVRIQERLEQLRSLSKRVRERESRAQTSARELRLQTSQQVRLKLLSALTRQVMIEINRLNDLALKARLAKEMVEAFHEDRELSDASRISQVAELLKMLRSKRRAAADPRIVRIMARVAQLQGPSGRALTEGPSAAGAQGASVSATASARGGTSVPSGAPSGSSAQTTGRSGPSTSLDIYQHKVDDTSHEEGWSEPVSHAAHQG